MKYCIKYICILAFLNSIASAQVDRIHAMHFDRNLVPNSIIFFGKIVDGAHWKDDSGEFLFFVTETGKIPSKGECETSDSCFDAEIYAFCYAMTNDSLSLLWKTVDYERNCSFDLYAGLADSSIYITDLDSNGIAECTFIYFLSCRSDVSPSRLKLIMHEGQKKFAIRGTTQPDPTQPADEFAGTMNVDRSFNSVDKRIKLFATKKFQEYIHKEPFKQF